MSDILNTPDQPTRTLFGHPIREETTASFFPQKMSIEEFCENILNNKDAFVDNMKSIFPNEKRFVEEWFETFGAWNEIEEN
jgi:hypothetical protein